MCLDFKTIIDATNKLIKSIALSLQEQTLQHSSLEDVVDFSSV